MGQVGVGVAAGVAAGALAGAAVTTTYPGQIGDLDNAGRTQWTRDNTRGDPKRLERGGAVSSGMIKLLLRARRFNATLAHSDGVHFAALAQREGVSRSYFTRLVRLSYLAPDITQAILDGRQPRDLTAEKLLEHSYRPD